MTYEIKVYKIWYEDCPEEFYIGSTKMGLSRRMAEHRSKVKSGRTSTIYSLMRTKGINNFKYVQVASCMVENIDEQRQFEQQWINELRPTLNTNRAFATEEDNKDTNTIYNNRVDVKERRQAYWEEPENKQRQRETQKRYVSKPEVKAKLTTWKKTYNATEETKQKKREYEKRVRRTCICGGKYQASPMKAQAHYDTQKHRQHIERVFLKLSKLIVQHQE
jgi:hypothetical protein